MTMGLIMGRSPIRSGPRTDRVRISATIPRSDSVHPLYDALMATAWTLRVKGKLRTTITLNDDRGELARLTIGGWPRDQRWCTAVDRDGVEWRVDVEHLRMQVRQGDEAVVWVSDDRLRTGDRMLTWTLRRDGSRRVSAVTQDGRSLFEAESTGCRVPDWAVLRIDDLLPEPFAVALAASAGLLLAEGDLSQASSGTSAGPAN
jgi:hypothetical protein